MKFTGKVLLTDDEAHIRKFIGMVIKRLGSPTIIEAANGKEAIELYKTQQPDLVLLDVNMPVLDGIQALTEIRRADPEALVIMLTSLTTFGGLMPLLLEKSVQARFLIPMAISLGFGVMFATLLSLLLVPAIYVVLDDLRRAWRWLYGGGRAPAVLADLPVAASLDADDD